MTSDPADEFDAALEKRLFGEPEPDTGPPGDRKMQARDPVTGKFVKLDAPPGAEPPKDGQPAAKPEPPKGTEPPPTEPAKKFKFAGEEWESQEAAEQNFKSMRGNFKSKDGRITQVEAERDEGYRTGHAWKAEHDRLLARNAELEAQVAGKQPAATPQPGSGGNGEGDLTRGIDMDAFEFIAHKSSLAKAGEYLLGEAFRVFEQKILPSKLEALETQINERLQPFEQTATQHQQIETMTQVATRMASLQTADGKTAFPELADPKKLQAIGRVWAEEGGDLQALSDPRGLLKAIGMYRLVHSFENQPPPATPDDAAPALPVTPAAPGAGASVPVDPGNGQVTPVGAARSNLPPATAALVHALDSPDLIDADLGFAKRARPTR
jgi:hypothetical protein